MNKQKLTLMLIRFTIFSGSSNRLHVAVHQLGNRSKTTLKYGENIKVARVAQSSVSLMFVSHFLFSVIFLLYRPTATQNLFVFTIKKQNVVDGDIIYTSVF